MPGTRMSPGVEGQALGVNDWWIGVEVKCFVTFAESLSLFVSLSVCP